MLNVNLLLLSNLLTKVGNYSTEVVIFLLALELSGENYTIVGIVYLVRFLPYVFCGPIGGWAADNLNKKTLMVFVEIIRLSLLTFLYFLFFIGVREIILFSVILSLLTVMRAFFQPAFQSSIPLLTPKEKLIKVNSMNQILEEVGSLLGPLLTAMIITMYDKELVLLIDALFYLISAILILFIKLNSNIKSKETIESTRFSVSFAFHETLSHIRDLTRFDKDLIQVIISSSLCILCVSSLLRFIFPAYVLELTGSERLVSYSFSALALGTIIGGLFFSRLNIEITASNTMKLWSLYGLLFCVLAFVPEFEFVIVLLILLGFVGAFVDILLVSFIQNKSNENNMGKNFSLFSTLANTGESGSGILGGFLAAISLKYSLIILSSFVIIVPSFNIFTKKKYHGLDEL